MEVEREHFLRPLMTFLDVSNNESDRGRILVAAAQIDGMLEEILRAFLLDNNQSNALFNSPNAPLSSLFNKANAASALGLISDKEFEAIETIRRVRNLFAHSVDLSMNDPRVADRIACLEIGIGNLMETKDPVISEPRSRFQMCVTSLISTLYNRAHYVKKNAASAAEWPL